MALGDRLSCLNKNGLMLKLTSKAITKRKLKFYRKRRPENVFVSAKDEVPVGDVNTEKPLAATAEANVKIDRLSIRAGSRPKQPATDQPLAGYFCLILLLILVRNLK